jgi:hypothetical protein
VPHHGPCIHEACCGQLPALKFSNVLSEMGIFVILSFLAAGAVLMAMWIDKLTTTPGDPPQALPVPLAKVAEVKEDYFHV